MTTSLDETTRARRAGPKPRPEAALPDPTPEFDLFIRATHWLTLLLIVAVLITANLITDTQSDQTNAMLRHLHRSFGLTVCIITVLRLAWRQFAHLPDWPADFSPRMQFLSKISERLLYLLLLAQPILGLLYTNAHGDKVNFYLLYRLPSVLDVDQDLGEELIQLHGLVANILLGLIGFHAATALYQHFVRRNRLLNRMLPRFLRS